jgi:hypothetical protein
MATSDLQGPLDLLKRLAGLSRRSRIDQSIDEELRSHLEMRTADNIAEGMTEEEARHSARLLFGNPLVIKEHVQSVDLALGVESFVADLRYALRSECFRKSETMHPSFCPSGLDLQTLPGPFWISQRGSGASQTIEANCSSLGTLRETA